MLHRGNQFTENLQIKNGESYLLQFGFDSLMYNFYKSVTKKS